VTVVARSAGLVAGARTHAHVCAADSRLTTGASVRLSPVPFMWPWLFAHVHCHAALQLLEKYLWLLAHVASDAGGKALLVGACCSFWQRAPQMRCILVRKVHPLPRAAAARHADAAVSRARSVGRASRTSLPSCHPASRRRHHALALSVGSCCTLV
jgi:hypothetical protein